MKRKHIIWGGVIVLLVIFLLFLFSSGTEKSKTILVQVKRGDFRITVTASGELEAKSSENIYGPDGLQSVRIWQVKIEDIIPEGTIVDSGDWVATLDRTELTNRAKDQELELEQLETQYTKTRLDTSLELRNARDELINLKYALEEARITLEQSKYEPPATIRQVEISLEKAQRTYDQAVKNYNLKYEKAKANMQDVSAQLAKVKKKYDEMLDVLKHFTITAPKPGMLIYKRNWDGTKMGIGSQLNAWENVVATLPNLTVMRSKIYVNEIDISKVKVSQDVEIGIDAFPDKKYSGKVTQVANIGEQMSNSNTKVFEVIIDVDGSDSILRPAMTTKNTIITDIIKDTLYLPIECIHSTDSISYVITKNTRKQVILGKSNENEIIVRAGLEEGDEVYLAPPEDGETYRLVELDHELVEKFRKENEDAQKKPAVPQDSLKGKMFDKNLPPPGAGGRGGVVVRQPKK
jgi:multidrug efflux pump subunit AcrA (membrane-fusion protein)